MRGKGKSGVGLGRRWRPLIAIVVAYAVAAQALLVALGGFAIAANTADTAPAFTLCLHDADSAPSAPAQIPADQTGCSHCVFCFAGAHHAAIAPPPVALNRAQLGVVKATWIADEHSSARLNPYAIANPRGPPRA